MVLAKINMDILLLCYLYLLLLLINYFRYYQSDQTTVNETKQYGHDKEK